MGLGLGVSRSSINLPRPPLGGSSMLMVERFGVAGDGNLNSSVLSFSVNYLFFLIILRASVSAFGSASTSSGGPQVSTTSNSTKLFPYLSICSNMSSFMGLWVWNADVGFLEFYIL